MSVDSVKLHLQCNQVYRQAFFPPSVWPIQAQIMDDQDIYTIITNPPMSA